MDDHAVIHDAFTIERTYPVPPATVFAAFASAQAKESWGTTEGVEVPEDKGDDEGANAFDLRIGGHEDFTVAMDGITYRYDARYYDIVRDCRLVYSYEMYAGGTRISVSLATIEFIRREGGTQLVWTEQGAYLDGHDGVDAPALRQGGTAEMLKGLAVYLTRQSGR